MDLRGCGAAGGVVAVDRGAERDGVVEAFVKLGAECVEVGKRDVVELKIFVETHADGVADDLVGFAEGDALVAEVGCSGHGVEVAGFGGGLHVGVAELERAGEVGQHAEQAGEGVGDVEDLLLAFLQVLVVGEGQAFDERGECGGCTEQAGGFAAG